MPAKNKNSFFLISKDDILLEIKNLKQNKAPGHDMIGTKKIKLCPEIFANNILEKIYNRAIEMGIYPDDMKITIVKALLKKGKKLDPNNYRPISLLSHFDKIYEKILCQRFISFLEINKIYYCHQFGFRKGYSTAIRNFHILSNVRAITQTNRMPWFCLNCHHWLHWKFSFSQFHRQPVMWVLSKWQYLIMCKAIMWHSACLTRNVSCIDSVTPP